MMRGFENVPILRCCKGSHSLDRILRMGCVVIAKDFDLVRRDQETNRTAHMQHERFQLRFVIFTDLQFCFYNEQYLWGLFPVTIMLGEKGIVVLMFIVTENGELWA